MFFAIIPAAGLSTRMGRAKLTLPLGERTVLQHVIAALLGGGLDRVLVVAGPSVSELPVMAALAGADVCLLAEQTHDMRATVERGFDWLEQACQPKETDFWLLVPGDYPMLRPNVVRQVLDASAKGKSIVRPVHDGRHGHPALLSWAHVAGIRQLPAGEGINAYLRARTGEILELPVDDPGVLADLDTPADYERMRHVS